MTNKYEKNVARMAAFNRTDESAVIAGKEEARSELIEGPVKQNEHHVNLKKE